MISVPRLVRDLPKTDDEFSREFDSLPHVFDESTTTSGINQRAKLSYQVSGTAGKFVIDRDAVMIGKERLPILIYCEQCRMRTGHGFGDHRLSNTGQPLFAGQICFDLRCQNCKGAVVSFGFTPTDIRWTPEESGFPRIDVIAIKTSHYPPPIVLEPTLQKYIPESDEDLLKKGWLNELHGSGIGAFAYYRRIVENNLVSFANAVLSTDEEREEYERIPRKEVANRIEFVSKLAPKSMFIDAGTNPFTVLYRALSDGLHNKTDKQCLELAVHIRTCLEWLAYFSWEKEARKQKAQKSFGALSQPSTPEEN